jgi:hypothetical protein
MKLLQATIRPGKVIEVLADGEIKASAPGLFSYGDSPDKLPPIRPWQIGSNCNSFSQPKKYDEVWVMNFADNPLQLYWFRKDRLSTINNIDTGEANVEILCNRDIDGEWATIYFSDGSGWVISKGTTVMQIRSNGSILLQKGDVNNRAIDINDQGISIGSVGTSAHPAGYGDVITDAFNDLAKLLRNLQIKSAANPYTTEIANSLSKDIPNFEKHIPKIMSSHVTLD